MLNILISLLTFVLILISLFMVLVILMQRANTNSGMGSAFGGGVAESAFGTETTNILVKATKWSAVGFFIIALILYLLFMSRHGNVQPGANDIPTIPIAEETAPAETGTTSDLQQAIDEAAAVTEDAVNETAAVTEDAVDETAAMAEETVDQAQTETAEETPSATAEETPPAP